MYTQRIIILSLILLNSNLNYANQPAKPASNQRAPGFYMVDKATARFLAKQSKLLKLDLLNQACLSDLKFMMVTPAGVQLVEKGADPAIKHFLMPKTLEVFCSQLSTHGIGFKQRLRAWRKQKLITEPVLMRASYDEIVTRSKLKKISLPGAKVSYS